MTFVLHLDAPQLTASSRIRGFTGSKLASFNMATEESPVRHLNPRHAIHPAQAAGACAISSRNKPTMESSITPDNGHGAHDDTSLWLDSTSQALRSFDNIMDPTALLNELTTDHPDLQAITDQPERPSPATIAAMQSATATKAVQPKAPDGASSESATANGAVQTSATANGKETTAPRYRSTKSRATGLSLNSAVQPSATAHSAVQPQLPKWLYPRSGVAGHVRNSL